MLSTIINNFYKKIVVVLYFQNKGLNGQSYLGNKGMINIETKRNVIKNSSNAIQKLRSDQD